MEPAKTRGTTAPAARPGFWHLLTHRWRQSLWTDIEHLPVPGYLKLYRQRCTCGETRIMDLA